jgi:hypothetical protein
MSAPIAFPALHSEHVCEVKWQRYEKYKHKEKMARVKSTIDCHASKEQVSRRYNAKKAMQARGKR